MSGKDRLFFGVKRVLRPLRLDRFKVFRKLNSVAWRTFGLQDQYLTSTANVAAGLLRPGDIALDVGANHGVVAKAMASVVDPTGTVHAFEPNERLHAQLRSIAGVQVHACAVGASEQELKLFIPRKNDTISSLSYNAIVASATDEELTDIRTETVPVRTIDSFGFKRVNLIKIDAQGAELDVLKGALATLRRCRPVIIIEVWPDGLSSFGGNAEEIMKTLRKLGYATTNFGGGPTWWDVLAIPYSGLKKTASSSRKNHPRSRSSPA